jgi:crossover junction endodeoxyribonuclease RuvC
MIYVGIDPGLTGACALIGLDEVYLEVFDIPTMLIGSGNRTVKRQVNCRMLVDRLHDLTEMQEVTCYIERVGSMPGQGCATTFSLGDSFGCLRAVASCLWENNREVTPNVWKRYFNIGSDKKLSLQCARSLFPAAKDKLTRAKDHNRAEALLIAYYGAMKGTTT